MVITLNRANLARLGASVLVPAYDPAQVRAGIVHLGLGGFHRAHMARYTHELMERDPTALEWGILGAGLLKADKRMQESLAPQDSLYTLVERGGDAETARAIGSLSGVIHAGDSSVALLDAIDQDAIRIVSLTITENGYCLNRTTKELDFDHALIRADLAAPEQPRSAIGILVEALRRRRVRGAAPFTPLTCDNIQHNGNTLRNAVLALARRRDPGLADWITAQVPFPNTMVDRITPVTSPDDIAALARDHGVADNWPVFSETFTQWVIEDRFVADRPAWEQVGAQFVDDVTPYELMKLRLLNGSHLTIAALGRIAGYTYIHECLADPLLLRYMAALMDRETGPTLPAVPGIDLDGYKRTLIARFANPAIRDTVERVNTDAPLNTLVVSIRARLDMGGSVDLLALGLAAWMRRVHGTDEQGRAIDVKHPMAATLRQKAKQGGKDPALLFSLATLLGDLGTNPGLTTPLRHWLESLYRIGARATLEQASRELGF